MSFTQVSLSELNKPLPSDPSSFDEWADFMAKGRGQAKAKGDCTPGKSYPCKSICLSTSKNCRNPLEGQAKNYADWLKAGGEKFTPTKVQTSLSKKRQASKSVGSKTTAVKPTKTNKPSFDNRLKASPPSDAIPDFSLDEMKSYIGGKARVERSKRVNDEIRAFDGDDSDRNKLIRSAIDSGFNLDADVLSLATGGRVGGLKKAEISRLQKVNSQNKSEIDSFINDPKTKAVDKIIDRPFLSPSETKGYKPLLSEDEATQYVKDSYMGDWSFHHGVSDNRAADSIVNDGVDIARNQRGIYGAGFYMGVNETIAESYADGNDYISSKVKVKNPYVLDDDDPDNLIKKALDDVAGDFEGLEETKDAFGGKYGSDETAPISLLLKIRGYDSIYVKQQGYFVAFQKEQVATYSRKTGKSSDELKAWMSKGSIDWELNKQESWNELNKVKPSK